MVIVPSPSVPAARAGEVFLEIERVHRLLEHPLVPRVSARGDAGGAPFLELDCDATLDGVEVCELLTDMRWKVPPVAARAFFALLRDGLTSAHSVGDPILGRPVCLGRLSAANLLFTKTGRLYLTGYGYNFPTEPSGDGAEEQVPCFVAPEVLDGGAPTPAGDMTVLRRFASSLLPLVDLGSVLARLLDDSTSADTVSLLRMQLAEPDPAGALMSVASAEADRDDALREPRTLEAFLQDAFARWAPDVRDSAGAPRDRP